MEIVNKDHLLKTDNLPNLYSLVNQQYFKEPRSVCVVDEINPIEDGVEVLVFEPSENERRWLSSITGLLNYKGYDCVLKNTGIDEYKRTVYTITYANKSTKMPDNEKLK